MRKLFMRLAASSSSASSLPPLLVFSYLSAPPAFAICEEEDDKSIPKILKDRELKKKEEYSNRIKYDVEDIVKNEQEEFKGMEEIDKAYFGENIGE